MGWEHHEMDDDELTEIAPLEVARVELTLKFMPDGERVVGFHVCTPDGGVPHLFDLHGMLSFAQATISDPVWQADAFGYDDEDEED